MEVFNWKRSEAWTPLGIGLLVYAIIRLINDSICKLQFWKRPWTTTLLEVGCVVLMAFVMAGGIRLLIKDFNKRSFTNTQTQISFELKRVLSFGFIIINVFGVPMMAFTDDGLQIHDFIIINVIVPLVVLLFFLILRMNHYLGAYLEVKTHQDQLIKQNLASELRFLKAQINPHFLFNALNNIYHQIDESSTSARKALEGFSNMLRYQLYECNQDRVNLKKELGYLSDYIDIQRLRFDDQLQVELDWRPLLENPPNQKIAPFFIVALN